MILQGYHATDRLFDGPPAAPSWFALDRDASEYYWSGEECGRMYFAEITFNNPLIVTREDFIADYPGGPGFFLRKSYFKNNDGVIIEEIMDGDRVTTIFAPHSQNQIKILSVEGV